VAEISARATSVLTSNARYSGSGRPIARKLDPSTANSAASAMPGSSSDSPQIAASRDFRPILGRGRA
jgi:hypothetical protein